MPAEETDGHDTALASALSALFGNGRAIRIADVSTLGAAADDAGAAAAVLSPHVPNVRILRLYKGNDVAFLINNEGGTPVRTSAVFPVAGPPELWDPRTGSTATASAVRGCPSLDDGAVAARSV